MCPDPTVLQKWCICIHASWMEGGMWRCKKRHILQHLTYFSAIPLRLRIWQDTALFYVRFQLAVPEAVITQQSFSWGFGSQAQSLTSHLNSHAQPHSASSSLVLAFLLFLAPKLSSCISAWRVCGCLDRRCLRLAFTSAKSHSVRSIPSLFPLPRRFSFPGRMSVRLTAVRYSLL